jgi:hypothetical protein
VLGVSSNGEQPYGIGVRGISPGIGVSAESFYDGTGLRGSADNGHGVAAESTNGAPLLITAGDAPTGGARQLGELYVNSGSKKLFFHDGTSWREVAFV